MFMLILVGTFLRAWKGLTDDVTPPAQPPNSTVRGAASLAPTHSEQQLDADASHRYQMGYSPPACICTPR